MLSYLIPVRLENKFQSSRVGKGGGGADSQVLKLQKIKLTYYRPI